MNKPGVEIGDMQWFDLADVAALEEAVYPTDAWSEATWWAELARRPRRHYIIARSVAGHRGELAGYAGIDINGDNADVMTIAVAAHQRGTGLGRALLARIHDEARDAGVVSMLLEVRADNTAALALYAADDYGQMDVRRGYYDHGNVDAIVMRRALTGAGRGHA